MQDLTIPNTVTLTMSSRQIAKLTKKEHRHIKRDTRTMFSALGIDQSIFGQTYYDSMNRPQTEYLLDEEHTLCLTSGYNANQRMAIIRDWMAMRAQQQQQQQQQQRAVPTNYREALAQLIVEIDAKEAAIATKAEIGTRREATAMNTASQATKKVEQLAIALDESTKWSTIKRMEMITGLKFDWRKLTEASADIGTKRIDVYDANYGTVKSYHADAWRKAYAIGIEQ